MGFRFEALTARSGGFSLEGDLYAAVGDVVAVHHPMRDRFSMPYPTIEVTCGSLGAMSGGAVLDDRGFLVGVTSRGLETVDGRGATFASWMVDALNRRLEIPWPPGVSTHLLDIDGRLLQIEGRDKITVIDRTTCRYEIWFDR